MYIVVIKIMDAVILGLDEMKSALINSIHAEKIAERILKEMGIGLTVLYGRGGYSGDERQLLYVVVERLQLAELKAIVYDEDPHAFVAIENIHEVSSGATTQEKAPRQSRIEQLIKRVFSHQ